MDIFNSYLIFLIIILFNFKRWSIFWTTWSAHVSCLFKKKAKSLNLNYYDFDINRSRFIPAAIFGYLVHMLVTKGVKNESFEHVIDASSSSWLQEHVTDLSET